MLVTGDAVVLELPPAGLGTRLLGIIIDVVVQVVVLVGLLWLFGSFVFSLDAAGFAAVALGLVVLALVVVPATVETLTHGRSLGKLALGLRVVRDDGGPIRSRHAIARALVGFGEIYLALGALSAPFVLGTHRAKRLGDLVAGTYVVNERTALLSSPMVQMPPELAGWAATADLGQVPGSLGLAARSYLSRLDGLSPQARAQLGDRLAGELSALVSPPPPAGTSQERFIAAVLAERRARDGRRIASEQAQLQRLRAMAEHARGV
ncbi:RDD family protein [Jannaschia sp. R86511]|uniref:RDD family protein n=1 Tax=Jannaschia sp. R86511 TaxID=3093853 RepID=UPI0036D234F5